MSISRKLFLTCTAPMAFLISVISFLKFCSNALFLFPRFLSSMCHDATTNLLFCLMALWYHVISTSSTLVCVLCIKLLNLLQVWHRWNGSWFTLIWYHKHRQTHTGHAETNIFTLTYKYTLTSPDMCALQLPVLHWMNNFLIKKFTLQRFTMSLQLKITRL